MGGGRGGNQNAANKAVVKQASVGKGHDGSATSSTTDATTSQPSADGPGLGAEGNGALSSATSEVEKGGAPAASPVTTTLLAEATQLLKSLRMPNLKVMRRSSIEPYA